MIYSMKKNKQYMAPLLTIAVPLILNNIISQVQMIIDRAFLGHMNDLYMSAVGNVSAPMYTTMSFCFSLCVGASILISQRVGAGKKEETEVYAAALMKWANVIPLLMFLVWFFLPEKIFSLMHVSETLMPMCLEYTRPFSFIFLILGLEAGSVVIMQTSNYTTPLVMYGIVRAGLNIFLDWVMIFGHLGCPAMGIGGAALATAISEYVGCAYAFYIFMTSKKLFTRPAFKSVLKASFAPYFESAKLGLNTAMEDLMWNVGNLMLIRILNSIDDMAAGIYSIVFSIEVIVVVIVGALGQSTMTLSSEAIGKKDRHQYRGVCIVAYVLSAAVTTVLLVLSFIIPEKLLGIFTADAQIIAVSITYLLIVCVNLYFKSANIIVGNGIRGSGNTKWMFGTQIFGTVFVIGSAALMVFVFDMGIIGVFYAVLADETVRSVINLLKYISINKKIKTELMPA